VYPEEVVVCKKYSDGGTNHPAVTIRFTAVVMNTPVNGTEYNSPTTHDFTLQPNECRGLWWTGGDSHVHDTVTVEELPLPGFTTASQVSRGTGQVVNPNPTAFDPPNVSASVSTTSEGAVVKSVVGSPTLDALTVVFTNTPEPPRYTLGKTMGFWGNTNGIATILANGGYGGANAAAIGRSSNIDTQGEAQKVFPSTLNACGKSTTIIFAGQTQLADCSLATGIKIGALNTAAGQTLALHYNTKFVAGYNGQTIAGLVCDAYLTGTGLVGTNSVGNALTWAISVLNGSGSGGTSTQTQVGALNALLGCLNRET
jgi:hypothetical protein